MITAHTLVKNEERFVWYAINSVLEHVDEMLVWDTGSQDKTVEIVKQVRNPKIKFNEVGEVSPKQLVELRNKMLEETKTEWIFILDGDEVWHDSEIKDQLLTIKSKGDKFDIVVNHNKMLVGDIYHYQEERAGRYRVHDKVGHLNIRFIKNMPGLSVKGRHPLESFVLNGTKVQDLPKGRILFSDNYYLHASFLARSEGRKLKHEIGVPFPKDYYFPEVFFRKRPKIVPSPWRTMDKDSRLRAVIETPARKLKRRIVNNSRF